MLNEMTDHPAVATIEKLPAITSIFTADPSAHVWMDGRIYIYASHDIDPAQGCDFMDRYHVFSSDNVVNWRDEGEILRANEVPWGRPEGGFMWAPDCAYKNGIYYFYYPHPSETRWNDTWKIGVAVSEKPAEGFRDIGYIQGLGGFAVIDPCVFMDDDGRSYMYCGGGARCQGGGLGEDMVSLKGGMRDMEGLEDFHEATWVFKRNSIYYLTYADNYDGRNRMRYAVSDRPLGPWSYQGIFLEPTGCDTTHGSVVEYKGQWYLFYHNCQLSRKGNLRTVCIDYLYFNDDGTIRPVVQSEERVRPVGNAPCPETGSLQYTAEDFTVGGGAVVEARVGGAEEKAVRHLDIVGSFCRLDHVDGKDGGRTTIGVIYAAKAHWTKLRLTVNGQDYSFLNMTSTGGMNQYTGYSYLTVRLNPGKNNSILFEGGNGEISLQAVTVCFLE